MSEAEQWIYKAGNDCAYCKDGLCARMNQLMEEGKSIRAASRIMEKECKGRWNWKTIFNNFKNWTDPNLGHRAQGTGQNEWFTPDIHIQAARDVMGEIDLDPATSEAAQKRIQAKQYFTPRENGLERDWTGRIWLNPPYSKPNITNFSVKMCTEVEAGRTSEAIMLAHAYTDTSWFHQVEKKAALICFTKGRIGFEEDDGHVAAPTQGQCFFYFGKNLENFRGIFKQFGFIR